MTDLSPPLRGNAPRSVCEAEIERERRVSRTIGAMPFLWLSVDDTSDAESDRGTIEWDLSRRSANGVGSPSIPQPQNC